MNDNQTILSAPRPDGAFTLIELLVVIAIIGILASLIVGGAGIAVSKSRRAGVEGQRDALITAIESYHNDKGFYPPDNTYTNTAPTNTYVTSLYYELTGTTLSNSQGNISFIAGTTAETFTAAQLSTDFNVQGFLNSSTDPTAVKNYYVGIKASQHEIVSVNTFTGHLLGINVAGPIQLQGAALSGNFLLNPWRYVSSHPTNNVDSFDLWMDVLWSGKTNRVNNWSKDPQVL